MAPFIRRLKPEKKKEQGWEIPTTPIVRRPERNGGTKMEANRARSMDGEEEEE